MHEVPMGVDLYSMGGIYTGTHTPVHTYALWCSLFVGSQQIKLPPWEAALLVNALTILQSPFRIFFWKKKKKTMLLETIAHSLMQPRVRIFEKGRENGP